MGRGKNKAQISESGMDLIYRQGFTATGIQQIADAAGVPKGSFYNYFKSKDDFVIQAIEQYVDESSEYLENKLLKASGSPLQRLEALYDTWIAGFSNGDGDKRGCLIGNLSQELANQNPTLRTALERAFKRTQSFYTRCLREAQQAGELSTDLDAEVLAGFITNAWQGALVRAKAAGNTASLKEFKQVVFEHVLR
jgi:TetR/AcrR family transcriptional repressor of nem operon